MADELKNTVMTVSLGNSYIKMIQDLQDLKAKSLGVHPSQVSRAEVIRDAIMTQYMAHAGNALLHAEITE